MNGENPHQLKLRPGQFSAYNRNMVETTLICTAGIFPQVVTTTIDLLSTMGEEFGEVVVIHTKAAAKSPMGEALKILRSELKTKRYPGKTFRYILLKDQYDQPLEDVENRDAAQAVFRGIYDAVRQAKLDRKRLHLSIAGGRKTMTIFGMATAQMLFEDEDKLWLLFSASDYQDSERLHPEKVADAELISIPFIPWSDVSPAILDFGQINDPYQAVNDERLRRMRTKYEKAKNFIDKNVKSSEFPLVKEFVLSGATNRQLSRIFRLTPKTIEHYLDNVRSKASDYFEVNVNRSGLISLLSSYIDSLPEGEPKENEISEKD
jgi:CRISPR-associated Csx14 family protein